MSYFHKLPAWIKSSKNRGVILKKIAILEKKSLTKPSNKTPLDIANDVKESFFYRWNWNNRSWKFLDENAFLKGNYDTIYYPDLEDRKVIIRNIKDRKLSIFKARIENGVLSKNQEIIEEISLKSTTKGTFRHRQSEKLPTYYLINVRNLNNEHFTVKELFNDVANMNIGKIIISDDLINFEEGDYIFMFTESKSSHPDFAPTPKDETRTYYGFSKSAMIKILKSIG